MKVIYGKSALEREIINETTVTVGTFDGVHKGHKALLERLVKAAHDSDTQSALVTFDPHPQMILGTKGPTEVLNTTKEKIHLLENYDLDLVIILEFNQQLATLDATSFVEWILVDQLKMKHFVIGYDHSFGKDRQGNYELAKTLSSKFGYTVEMVGPVYDNGNPVKSSAIRRELKCGDYERAVTMLGYRYFLTGDIIKGHGIGKKLGYPTLNLNLPAGKLLPKSGVYAAWMSIEDREYPGMAYIGGRLTFGDETLGVEVNLFGFDKNTLGKETKLTLQKFTRPPMKFDSQEHLRQALARDEHEVKEILNI
jgi:riboflavin kinase/FMN adenylyltransferase